MNKDNIDKLQKDWANEPSYSDLNEDVEGMAGLQDSIRNDLSAYRLSKEGGKKVVVKTGKSNTRPLVVRTQQEWKYASLEEPFLNNPKMFDIRPRGKDDELSARQNGIMLNYQYDTLLDKTKLINDVVRSFVDEGTVIIKTGWEVEYGVEEVEQEVPVYASAEESLLLIQGLVQAGQMSPEEAQQIVTSGKPMQSGVEMQVVEQEVLIKNQPKHEVLDGANVGIDPTAEGDISKAKFIWHEYETSFAELVQSKYEVDDEGNESGYYKNIEAAIAAGEEDAVNRENKADYEKTFMFNDKARKKIKAVEYWGTWDIQGDGKLVSIVAEWVNGVMVRLEENPFPHGRLPFSMAQYMPVLRGSRGEPDCKLIDDKQDAIGKLTRAAHDIASVTAVGQEFIDNSLFISPADKQQYEKGNTVYVTPGADVRRSIYRRSVDPIDPSIFKLIETNTAESEVITGTRPFSGGGGTGAGLGLAKISLDATAKRELSVLRRLSALFVDMARMVISMNQAYQEEEQVVRVTDGEYVEVRRDDLEGRVDLRIGISTAEKDAQQSDSLSMVLQTNAASMDPGLYKKVLGRILRLQYEPDLAHDVETFEPEPDAGRQELQALAIEKARLENEKLKAEMLSIQSIVSERATRSTENIQADIQNKLAQAELRAAQAELALANAELARSRGDQIDQDVLDTDSGIKSDRSFSEREHKASLKMEENTAKVEDAEFFKPAVKGEA